VILWLDINNVGIFRSLFYDDIVDLNPCVCHIKICVQC